MARCRACTSGVNSSLLGRQRVLNFKLGAFRGGERVVNEPQVPQGVNVLDRLYVVDDGLKITSLVGLAGEVLEDGVFRAQDFQ